MDWRSTGSAAMYSTTMEYIQVAGTLATAIGYGVAVTTLLANQSGKELRQMNSMMQRKRD